MSATSLAEVRGVHKAFNGRPAVEDVSLSVQEGELLGLVGPNGAGKTTTIRILLNILPADRGEVRLFGRPPDESAWAQVGYLPEERGLYREVRVAEVLEYLARLKGMPPQEARTASEPLLRRLGLWEHRHKKAGELSRGMHQLVQLVGALQHRPRLAVLDEPFSGLDPVNVRLLKEVIEEFRRRGTAFILSTHQMDQVEEMCDTVAMVNRGRLVLYGTLREVKARFRTNLVRIACHPSPEGLPGVASLRREGDAFLLTLQDGVKPSEVLRSALERGLEVERFETSQLPLEEIFVRVVTGRGGGNG